MNLAEQLRTLLAQPASPALLSLATVDFAYPEETAEFRDLVKRALLAASIPHWCDPDFLAALLETNRAQIERVFSGLRGLAIVEAFPARGADAIDVHEASRLALREQLRTADPARWQHLSALARAHVQTNTEAHARIEALYHLYAVDQDAAVHECDALSKSFASERQEYRYALGIALAELRTAGWLKSAALEHSRAPVGRILGDGRALLSRVWLFTELAEPELDLVAQIAQRRRFPARRAIVRQGETDADLYVVLSGHLKVSACDLEGREIVMNLMQPGEVFGEIGLLDGAGRSATVTSLEACELLVIRRADFLHLLRRSPSIASTLLTVLAKRVRRLTDQAQDSAFLDVKSRLAKRLVDLADQFGVPLGPRQIALRVRLSQQELGDMVQATRETVNKCLREWAREGIIERNGRQLVIRDRERLKMLAG